MMITVETLTTRPGPDYRRLRGELQWNDGVNSKRGERTMNNGEASGGLQPSIEPESTTIHEVVGRIPGASEVFRRFGIDTCCGGDLPLATAAEHHDADLELLLDALEVSRGTGE
jgi:hypothetical protein